MQTWSISHSREGFYLHVEKIPRWADLLSWPIEWMLSWVGVIRWDRVNILLYKMANGMARVQDNHTEDILVLPISDEDATKIDSSFVRMVGDFWDD